MTAQQITPQPKITTERRGHVLLIGANRPAKLNAYDVDMLRQLGDAFGELERDDDLRCGVIFAHGEHFTAGLDLGDVAPAIVKGELALGAGAVDPWGVHGTQRTKPTVIAVHGRCLTLGIELVLAQDICVAAATTRFGQIEIKRGIFPFGGATFRLVQRAGWGNAMRWLLTGDEFDAAEALRIGLVQEVVEPGRQLERAIQIAETIAAQAPLGVRATIANARKSLVEQAAIDGLMDEIRVLMSSADAREGLMSFMERRAAKFTGK
ncbi:MAG: crotonase/enoyl-CoA hydratase family protein [Deltaproteobacteria bacterium]|nr:crotonase/enoyl-CoA hydratase family protein [Deltaproteobacteria bacterium]